MTFQRDKLKEVQDALDKVQKIKKQDKLLSTVTQDVAHDMGPADHLHNYLKKYKNNHTTSSLPYTTRSNACPDKRIWMKFPPILSPLNWHCFRFALGHHLFQHPLSPYDEKSAQDVVKLLPRMKEQASTEQPLPTPCS